MIKRWNNWCYRMVRVIRASIRRLCRAGDPGQGTTEYAILVGVLVVVAIAAIILLKPMIETLWNGIVDGIGQLG